MYSRYLSLLLTLVLVKLASAAPSNSDSWIVNQDLPSQPGTNSERHDKISTIEELGLVISPVSMSTKDKREASYFYPYRQAISPRFFFIGDIDLMREGQFPYGLGMMYLVPSKNQPQWEIGADLLSIASGQISVGSRHIYFSDNYFRPFYKISLSHIWKATEKLASFANWKNYLLRAGVGFEDVIKIPMSARLEVEAAVGSEDFILMFSFGYSWGW